MRVKRLRTILDDIAWDSRVNHMSARAISGDRADYYRWLWRHQLGYYRDLLRERARLWRCAGCGRRVSLYERGRLLAKNPTDCWDCRPRPSLQGAEQMGGIREELPF